MRLLVKLYLKNDLWHKQQIRITDKSSRLIELWNFIKVVDLLNLGTLNKSSRLIELWNFILKICELFFKFGILYRF